MQDAFDADLVDVDTALGQLGRPGRIIHRVAGTGGLLAWYCHRNRKRYEVIVSDGEQVGLPLAILQRFLGRGTARHLMIVHIMSVPKKAGLTSALRLARLIDCFVVYCSFQREFIIDRFGVPPDDVVLTTFQVDTQFFDPSKVEGPDVPLISSAGLERRDYATLLRAVDGLDVSVLIAADSPWSKREDSTQHGARPANVEFERLSLHDLRDLYGRSNFVVMPLEAVDFQAGITTILEAMSMGKAVICSRTVGQNDTLIEGETAVYVEAHDPAALRQAVVALLDDDARATQLGANARRWVVENADVHRYSDRLATEVQRLRQVAR
ncbi:MAG: glycosyltransferase family 4 protein [Ilumatobacter sp.]|uniref:glycosyltransferase family 4 protein n=1 Tax=Ilumatobacter sp. TaxID=1967498 RepID=UPI0032996E2D